MTLDISVKCITGHPCALWRYMHTALILLIIFILESRTEVCSRSLLKTLSMTFSKYFWTVRLPHWPKQFAHIITTSHECHIFMYIDSLPNVDTPMRVCCKTFVLLPVHSAGIVVLYNIASDHKVHIHMYTLYNDFWYGILCTLIDIQLSSFSLLSNRYFHDHCGVRVHTHSRLQICLT